MHSYQAKLITFASVSSSTSLFHDLKAPSLSNSWVSTSKPCYLCECLRCAINWFMLLNVASQTMHLHFRFGFFPQVFMVCFLSMWFCKYCFFSMFDRKSRKKTFFSVLNFVLSHQFLRLGFHYREGDSYYHRYHQFSYDLISYVCNTKPGILKWLGRMDMEMYFSEHHHFSFQVHY